ncbi:MAG: cyclodeaminase/cyclohydrolase family protein [Lachnospiraceae bacterium]|jgi:formiminotetrahydrofolate cyclodeaminase|nr:cyclodeaminase/cyclohydrolase family protein [Lachnospiraceae bacterium]
MGTSGELSLKDMSVEVFSELAASSSPAPGGGSVAAMAGAYGAALLCMVVRLTLGKKKYAEVQGEMEEILAQAEGARMFFLESIQKDCEAFDAFMAAAAMPGGASGVPKVEAGAAHEVGKAGLSEETKNEHSQAIAGVPGDVAVGTGSDGAAREAAMEAALKGAALAPMAVAERALACLPLAMACVERGNPNAVTDALTGTYMLLACIRGSLANVRINLGQIEDEVFKAGMVRRYDRVRADAAATEEGIMASAKGLVS